VPGRLPQRRSKARELPADRGTRARGGWGELAHPPHFISGQGLDGSRAEVVASAGRFLDHPEKLEELVVEGIELEDGRAALVTARVETDRGPLAALLEVVVTSECPPAPRYMFGSFQYERRTADSHAGSPPPEAVEVGGGRPATRIPEPSRPLGRGGDQDGP